MEAKPTTNALRDDLPVTTMVGSLRAVARMFNAIRAGNFMAARKHELRVNKVWRSITDAERLVQCRQMFTDDGRAKFHEVCGPNPENLDAYQKWLHERGTDYGFTMDEEIAGTIADHVEHRQRRLNGRAFLEMLPRRLRQ